MAHLENTQIKETLAQLRPAEILQNTVTKQHVVDDVHIAVTNPDSPDKAKAERKEKAASVPYYKLFRFDCLSRCRTAEFFAADILCVHAVMQTSWTGS